MFAINKHVERRHSCDFVHGLAAVEKLYLPPQRLKRLARQLGLPSHVVIRKFDKKAAQLMGVGTALSLRGSGSSGGSGMSSAGSAVWESVEGNLEPELPFHMAGDETPRNPLKKPAGLRVETKF